MRLSSSFFSTYFASLEMLFNPCFILLVPYFIRGWQVKRGKRGSFDITLRRCRAPCLHLTLRVFYVYKRSLLWK